MGTSDANGMKKIVIVDQVRPWSIVALPGKWYDIQPQLQWYTNRDLRLLKRVVSSGLTPFSKIFNDTKHRAVSSRQL